MTPRAAWPEQGAEDETSSVLVVGLRGALYGFPQAGPAILLPWLQRYRPATPLPAVPHWILGLLSVQGTVQVVIDLGQFLGHQPLAPTPTARLVFLEWQDHQIGLAVDEEVGMRRVTPVGPYTETDVLAGLALLQDLPVKIFNGAILIKRLEDVVKQRV